MQIPEIDLTEIKTIDQVIARAREQLDPSVFSWAASGAGVEVTVAATLGPSALSL